MNKPTDRQNRLHALLVGKCITAVDAECCNQIEIELDNQAWVRFNTESVVGGLIGIGCDVKRDGIVRIE